MTLSTRRILAASAPGFALHFATLRCVLRLSLQQPKFESFVTPTLTNIHDLLSISRAPHHRLA